MPRKPCVCSFGHRFFKNEAEALDFKCDKEGSPIVCPAVTDQPKPRHDAEESADESES
jgi:hypothetical protein